MNSGFAGTGPAVFMRKSEPSLHNLSSHDHPRRSPLLLDHHRARSPALRECPRNSGVRLPRFARCCQIGPFCSNRLEPILSWGGYDQKCRQSILLRREAESYDTRLVCNSLFLLERVKSIHHRQEIKTRNEGMSRDKQ